MTDYVGPVGQRIAQPNWPLSFDENTGPYAPITNIIKSIRQDFINLLRTNPGEWPNVPDLGVGLERLLFENSQQIDVGDLKQKIQTQLNKYLSSLRIIDISYERIPDNIDLHYAKFTVFYYIEDLGEDQTLVEYVTDAGGNFILGRQSEQYARLATFAHDRGLREQP